MYTIYHQSHLKLFTIEGSSELTVLCVYWVAKRGRCYCSCTSLFISERKQHADFQIAACSV